MADEKANGNEPTTDREKPSAAFTAPIVPLVASSLAGMFLENQINKGREIEIPSLGIKVGKANLGTYNDSRNLDTIKEEK